MQERFETFTALISGINHSIRKIKTAVMSEFDLKSTHVYCIYYLHKFGSLTSKELSDMCAEDKASVSRSIKYLEKRGYIAIRKESNKRYRIPLELTEEGKNVGDQLSRNIDAVLNFVGSEIPEEHREAMYDSLKLINYKLIEICDQMEE